MKYLIACVPFFWAAFLYGGDNLSVGVAILLSVSGILLLSLIRAADLYDQAMKEVAKLRQQVGLAAMEVSEIKRYVGGVEGYCMRIENAVSGTKDMIRSLHNKVDGMRQ